jgi:hypothetical protein
VGAEESSVQKLWRAVIASTVEEWVNGPLRPKRAAQTAAQGFAPADTPTTTANQKKRDTSNGVRKGTFLTGLDSE